MFYKKTLPLLLLIFGISVLVRIPNLDRPLSKHHEYCTSVALTVITNWYDTGLRHFHCNPVMSFRDKADKFINNNASASGKMLDQEGNYYYVSHPPLAYYIPFYIFRTLCVRPNAVGLQLFNMFCQFIAGLFIYLIVNLLCIRRGRSDVFIPSLIAFSIYTFNPATLWFQSNVYMSDMLVHTFFVIAIYTTLKFIIRERFFSLKYIFWYSLVLAAMCYTSWLGYIFAGVVLIYSLWKLQYVKGFYMLGVLSFIIPAGILILTVYQYSQIAGFHAWFAEMTGRYAVRGSLPETPGLLAKIWVIMGYLAALLVNYVVHYNAIYLWLGAIFLLVASKSKVKFLFSRNGYRFIILSGFTILIMHIVFLEYSHHDFTVLYGSAMLSVLVGVMYEKLSFSGAVRPRTLNLSIFIMILVMVNEYYAQNLPGAKSFRGIPYIEARQYGELIRYYAKPGQALFIVGDSPGANEIYYAGRNILGIHKASEASAHMREYDIRDGLIFTYNPETHLPANPIPIHVE